MSEASESPVEQPDRPSLTLRDAAEACSISLSTIRRRHRAGAFEHAHRDNEGRWLIPVNDLLAAGLSLAKPVTQATEQVNEVSEPPHHAVDHQAYERRITELEHQVELERSHRAYTEQIADERLRQIEDYRNVVRMLDAGPSEKPAQDPAPEKLSHARTAEESTSPTKKRRWWQP